MNYRHQFHAGNFADVVKHVVLTRLFAALQEKEKGFLYLDTHAGRGGYDLQSAAVGDSLAREPEWPGGIGRLLERADAPSSVAEYVELIRAFDRARGNLDAQPRFYPGSPWIARRLARRQDRIVLCELNRAECDALRREFGYTTDSRPLRLLVQEVDGYQAIKSYLPPPERRGLVLIDPPYEAQNEFEQATGALADGLRRFPSGVYALWYPLTQRARVEEFVTRILALAPPPTLLAEVAIAGDASTRKLKGCGLVIVNPPWRLADELAPSLEYLAGTLAQEPGARAQVAWLVPEK